MLRNRVTETGFLVKTWKNGRLEEWEKIPPPFPSSFLFFWCFALSFYMSRDVFPVGVPLGRDAHYFAILRRFSNQLSRSDCFAIPRQMRITKITEIQIKRRTPRLTIPITRNMANIATIIKNGGELINSCINDSII